MCIKQKAPLLKGLIAKYVYLTQGYSTMSNSNESRPTFIYVLKDPITEEVRYVGKTVLGLKRRFSQHLCSKERNHRTNWIQSLVNLGLEPIIELIETVSPDEDWVEREKHWIKWYRDNGARLTNLTDGGEGATGHLHSEEARRKISEAVRNPSDETRQKMSKAKRGKIRGEEHCRKISEVKRKPVLQYDKQGDFIRRWESIKHAEHAGIANHGNISSVCKGERKSAGGFVWCYADE